MLNELKKEARNLLIFFIVTVIILQIIFFKENILTTIRTAFAWFWLFVLPGYALMLYWREKLNFLERAIIGTLLGLAIIGVIGYNLGVLGLNITIRTIILPIISIVVGVFLAYKKK